VLPRDEKLPLAIGLLDPENELCNTSNTINCTTSTESRVGVLVSKQLFTSGLFLLKIPSVFKNSFCSVLKLSKNS